MHTETDAFTSGFEALAATLAGEDRFTPEPTRIDPPKLQHIRNSVLEHFFSRTADSELSPALTSDVDAHVTGRYNLFRDYLLPWVASTGLELEHAVALEVGSGTGASSAAFAPVLKELHCFEIDARAVRVWHDRMDAMGVENAACNAELFGRGCEFVASGRKADLIVFCAVLEHLTDFEFEEIVLTAWDTLRAGGLMVIADTPNRFAPVDYHTSLQPGWSALTDSLKMKYGAAFSPREDFRHAMAASLAKPGAEGSVDLARWGRGISFHDLEVLLGRDVHSNVVLTGYEPQITAVAPTSAADGLLYYQQRVFTGHPVSPAFSRPNLYLAIRKP